MSSLARARFAQIVLPRLDEAYRLARWLTGNPTDAEDVIQESCLRAYQAIGDFAEGNARAWFLTIVRNCSYSWLQKHRPQSIVFIEDLNPAALATLELGNAINAAPETPEDAVIAKGNAVLLQNAINALPLPLRETLVLREYHGLSYRDIAVVSGVPIGTVMSRLASARQKLIVRLNTEGRYGQ